MNTASNKTGQRKTFLDLLLDNWWLRHLLFWIIVLNYYAWGMGYKMGQINIKSAYLSTIRFFPGFLIVVYPLLYILIPRFLVKKQFLLFIAGFLVCIALASYNTYLLNVGFNYKDSFKGLDLRVGKNILPYIHIAGLATAVKMGKLLFMQQHLTVLSQQQKTEAELQLLKAQIHPHFLFNTLNNLFAHTLQNSPESSKIVVKLSELLRFMIFESKADTIPLTKEVHLLENYINLERIRYGDELLLTYSFTGDLDNKLIRPLLLLPLVENCFKHGTSQQLDQKWIKVDLHVDKNELHFMLANSRDPDFGAAIVPGKTKGIGLENVKRRLELLYPGRYFFDIKIEPTLFAITMTIDLSQDQSESRVKTSSADIKHTAA